MVKYDQWITPSFNQHWKTIEGENDDDGDKQNPLIFDFDKGFIPSSVTSISIRHQNDLFNWGQGEYPGDDWIPDSVTMLSVPKLPFHLVMVPKKIKYLQLSRAEYTYKIEADMLLPTTEYLWIKGPGTLNTHLIPNTIKEVVFSSCNLNGIRMKPTFTSPIHIKDPINYHGDIVSKLKHDVNVQSITLSHGSIILPPTFTSLIITPNKGFNNSLAALHPLPPHLKHLSLPYTYQQPIYQQQHIPHTLTHLELCVVIDKRNNRFTNDWLCRKGTRGDKRRFKRISITRELVLPESFKNHIHNVTLPSTLESLSINNPDYSNQLNNKNLPLSLTSFKCNSSVYW
ncbi:hypothetical protein CYY_009371 [Polysphondylium violaceum]|uniref:Uncharacterized protein n=1 Tax=Polysphondylium violaceum TaxID=133409 RepID=A0A8J4PTS2_9MYCE|nr:hypothetical protein CYY_009371 [Polysphondylium violaceum]